MTTVHISLGRDDGTDQTAAKGVVEWEPTTRREDGTMVILERGFVAPLVDGEATVVVDPSGLTWCWRVTERTDSGGTVSTPWAICGRGRTALRRSTAAARLTPPTRARATTRPWRRCGSWRANVPGTGYPTPLGVRAP